VNVARLLTLDAVVTEPGAPTRDGFGDPVPGAGAPTTYKGWYEQSQRSEDTTNTDQQAEQWRLFLEPAAATVTGSATVEIGEGTFELDGPPWAASNPRTGQVTHIEATMKRVR
jgi:hypothetical protein